MPKFLHSNQLNAEIENLIASAENFLCIVSPYIKLHDRYISVLKTHLNNPELNLIVMFGKNEDDPSKSMTQKDLEFFTQFPNVVISYDKNLHAKYIANDSKSIITSMNFHKFSQDNNIEIGVLIERLGPLRSKVGIGDSKFDDEAWSYFDRVLDQATVIFDREPQYETKLLGLRKKYIKSETKIDSLSEFFNNTSKFDASKVKSARYKPLTVNDYGFCISSGAKIPLNIERPYSYEAFLEWTKHSDKSAKANYCHFTGEPSEGKTSFERPILMKNWRKYNSMITKTSNGF